MEPDIFGIDLQEIINQAISSGRVDCGNKAADWFSSFVGKRCRLVSSNRKFRGQLKV